MTRLNQGAHKLRERTIAACNESAIKGLYADALPAPAPTLRQLWIAAAEASEANYRAAMNRNIPEDEYVRVEEAALEARQALLDHLLNEHGLTTADVGRLDL